MDATTPESPGFADWLRQQMIASGYQMDGPRPGGPSLLARQLGVHRSTITRALSGQTIPKDETLIALANRLGVPLGTVLQAAGLDNGEGTRPGEFAPSDADETEPDPKELLDGGLRDQHEKAIWGMKPVPWQARHAAIDAMRREARRMAAEKDVAQRTGRRPA